MRFPSYIKEHPWLWAVICIITIGIALFMFNSDPEEFSAETKQYTVKPFGARFAAIKKVQQEKLLNLYAKVLEYGTDVSYYENDYKVLSHFVALSEEKGLGFEDFDEISWTVIIKKIEPILKARLMELFKVYTGNHQKFNEGSFWDNVTRDTGMTKERHTGLLRPGYEQEIIANHQRYANRLIASLNNIAEQTGGDDLSDTDINDLKEKYGELLTLQKDPALSITSGNDATVPQLYHQAQRGLITWQIDNLQTVATDARFAALVNAYQSITEMLTQATIDHSEIKAFEAKLATDFHKALLVFHGSGNGNRLCKLEVKGSELNVCGYLQLLKKNDISLTTLAGAT